jgi:imidazolonepropionase
MIAKIHDDAVHAVTLVRGARQLLTLRGPAGPRRGAALGELGVIPDGALLIRGGEILEAGPSRRV